VVKLTLIDYTYSGPYLGIYSASSVISLKESTVQVLPDLMSEYASQENTMLQMGQQTG
jgi:hypothetical protein